MSTSESNSFAALHTLISGRMGSILSTQQRARIDAALSVAQKSIPAEELLAHLQSPQGEEALQALMAAATVNKTDLFRDEVQLGAFFHEVLCPMVARDRRPLSVWSAGCSTGEEVATLLVLLEEAGADRRSVVLGSDISRPALERARRLSFAPDILRHVSPERQQRFFERHGAEHRLKPGLAGRARFEWHNLMDEPYPTPERGEGFDIIFCRNVLIYFSEAAFDRTVALLAQRLAPGGVLVLSAAEPILRPSPEIEVLRHGQAFFYTRAGFGPARGALRTEPLLGTCPPLPTPLPPTRALGTRSASVTGLSLRTGKSGAALASAPVTSSSAGPSPQAAGRTSPATGRRGVAGTGSGTGEDDPLEEARRRFQQALEWAGEGKDPREVELGLRQCLYLDPQLAQARYLLAVLLEERDACGEARVEYRRALAALEQGKSRDIPFFLNAERLKSACAQAVKRLGAAGP